jgi:hypothetical protein
MHPDQLYTLAQQRAKQLRHEAKHSRLTREARHKLLGNQSGASSQQRSLHWLAKISRYLPAGGGTR